MSVLALPDGTSRPNRHLPRPDVVPDAARVALSASGAELPTPDFEATRLPEWLPPVARSSWQQHDRRLVDRASMHTVRMSSTSSVTESTSQPRLRPRATGVELTEHHVDVASDGSRRRQQPHRLRRSGDAHPEPPRTSGEPTALEATVARQQVRSGRPGHRALRRLPRPAARRPTPGPPLVSRRA